MSKKIDHEKFRKTVDFLKKKKRVLILTTSNRWFGEKGGEIPKSSLLAEKIAKKVGKGKVKIIDVTKLKIYNCEGNVSAEKGNTCGEASAILKDKKKNPSGYHRCWASINNPDDELWKISKELFKSDCVVFLGSVRWGQTNAYYQKLIERLTWIENRESTFGEKSIVDKIEAGIIMVGHNWNGGKVIETEKKVLSFFGFNVIDNLCWNWFFTNANDESLDSYKKAAKKFKESFIP